MSGLRVRRQFMKGFTGLKRYRRWLAAGIVAGYGLQVLAAMAAGVWLLRDPGGVWGWAGVAALGFFISTRLRGFNNIIHECSHYSFAETRDDNRVLGSLCAALVMTSFREYRDEHLTHHAHLGDFQQDLDLRGIEPLGIEEPLTWKRVAVHALRPVFGLHFRYYLSPSLSGRDGWPYLALKLALVAGALAWLVADPVAALCLVWLPFVWGYTAINYWTDCIDHGGLVDAPDELEASRNFILPWPLRALLFPRNDCFHLVHHLFPQVPARHLGECHMRLMTNDIYRQRVLGDEPPMVMTPAE